MRRTTYVFILLQIKIIKYNVVTTDELHSADRRSIISPSLMCQLDKCIVRLTQWMNQTKWAQTLTVYQIPLSSLMQLQDASSGPCHRTRNLMCQNCSTNQMSPNSSGLLVIIDEFHYEVPGCRKINPNVQEQLNQAKWEEKDELNMICITNIIIYLLGIS